MPQIEMKTKAPLSADAPLRVAGTLVLLSRALDVELRRRQGAEPLTVAELNVLGQVSRGNALPSVIARAMRLDPARVTRLADRLVALGYLARSEDAADRRRCLLHLTASGEERLLRGKHDLSDAMASLLDGLSLEDRTAFTHSLEAVRELLDGREG